MPPTMFCRFLAAFAIVAIVFQQSISVLALQSSSRLKLFHPKLIKHNFQNRLSKNIEKFPLDRINYKNTLFFKVSETEEEAEVEEDVADESFDRPSGTDLMKKLSKGAIPLASTLAFALTPSSSIAIRIVGATAGGLVGFLAQKILNDRLKALDDSNGGNNGGYRDSSGPSKEVLNALKFITSSVTSISSLSGKSLETLAKKFKVPENELAVLFTYIYAELIFSSTKKLSQAGSSDLTELVEVIDFPTSAGLTPAEAGDGFAIAANRCGLQLEKDDHGFFAEVYPHETLDQASKILFLADKVISKGFDGYYGKRLVTGLSYFPIDKYEHIITSSCMKLYRRCIDSIIANPSSFTGNEVDELRAFLSTASPIVSTFRPANMENMILESIQTNLQKTLQGGDLSPDTAMKISVNNYDSLVKAKELLGWNTIEFDATLEIRTFPIFESVAARIIDDVIKKPEHVDMYTDVLQERVSSLKIDLKKARGILTSIISAKNAEYMEKIDKVFIASKGAVDPAFKVMASYASGHAALCQLVEPLMDGAPLPIPGLPFAELVRSNLFEMQLTTGGKDKNQITEDMFSLTDSQRTLIRKSLALPKISGWVTQCLQENNYSEGARKAYEKLLEEYAVTSAEWARTATDFYYQEVQKIATTRAVPTAIDLERLANIRAFLGIVHDSQTVSNVNLELFGDKYVKALTECMTPTGVISEDYIDGLKRLQTRLGLSNEDSKTLLAVAARTRLGPVIKSLLDQYKSDTDPKVRAEKEEAKFSSKRSDPISSTDNFLGYVEDGAQKTGGGPNVFMRESLNLIDFFQENFLAQGVDINTLENLPVTASGIVSEKDLVDLYKHYVITSISEREADLSTRYAYNEKLFALALGIAVDSQLKVKESLAYTASKNMIKNILRFRDSVTATDLKQLAALGEKLSIDPATAENIFDDACKGAVIEHASTILRTRDGLITAEVAQKFRTQVQSLGFNLQKDVGFNDKLVAYLYALEVQYLIENGMEDQLKDIQEAYDIPDESAEKIVEACSKRYINQILNLALRAAKKYDEKGTMVWVKELVKYAVFVEGTVDADGNIFSEKDKLRLIGFYESSDESEGITTAGIEKDEMAEKLKNMINVTEDYVAPLSGIEGLLGNVQNLNDLMIADPSANKKRWAWG